MKLTKGKNMLWLRPENGADFVLITNMEGKHYVVKAGGLKEVTTTKDELDVVLDSYEDPLSIFVGDVKKIGLPITIKSLEYPDDVTLRVSYTK